jgi:glycosyltransferase involved in cell wall biosynthesis
MRIAYITAGAGGMLCGTCLHDNSLAAALKRAGHEVALIPLYTPIRTDEQDVSMHRVFYGAVNVYLRTRSPLAHRLLGPLARLLDRPGVLAWASKRGASVDPRDLGALTLSVLRGEDGQQRGELASLVAWLRDSFRPDVVHLSHTLFLGLAREIRREVGVPVVCSVQGEDLFLDGLIEPYRSDARRLLRERSGDVDRLVATCEDYAGWMAGYLAVGRERLAVVPLGINLRGLEAEPAEPPPPFTVGYLARIAREKGLHLLVEAVGKLAKDGIPVRLRAAGYLSDRAYLEEVQARARQLGIGGAFEYVGEVDRPGKIAFLRSLHALSVPAIFREPKGLYILEALASGVPVVQPHYGAFPELIQETGGGLLVVPDSPEALAAGLRRLRDDPALRRQLGSAGRSVVWKNRSDDAMASGTLALYRAATAAPRP